jgi:hypothetical protein
LFNFYEYLAICINKNFVKEIEIRLFFNSFLKEVKILFEDSFMFKENYATKEQYKGIQWLFKKWNL